MKSFFLVNAMVLSTMTALAQSSTDDAQIKQLIKTIEDGWAKKSGDLFASSFAEDADYVVVNGMFMKGRKVIAEAHQHIFDTFYKETNIQSDVKDIRYLKPDIAIVHLISHLTGMSNGEKLDNKSYITLTLEKKSTGWLIAAFQNTPIKEQPTKTGN